MLRPTLVSLIALSLLSAARADFSIVQTARMSVGEGESPVQAMTVYQKAKKTRYDLAGRLTVILDTDAKTRTTLDRLKKTYSVDPYEPKAEPKPPGKITIAPTERKTTIAGHPTRLYLWKTTMGDIQIDGELWAAEDIERVYFPSILGEGFDQSAQNKGMKGHPLRIRLITQVKGGARAVLTSEVAAISTKELPESYFEIPEGYEIEKKPEPKPGIEPPPPAPAQTDTFEKATGLRARFRGKATRLNLVPNWLPDGRFWYDSGRGFVLVDPKTGTKSVVADPKTLPGTGATLPPVHPSDLRAGGGNGETKITFVNRTSTPVKIFWLEDETQKREYTTLQPGKDWSQNTYIGHAWLVTDERAAPLVGFIAAEGASVAQIDGKTVRPRPRALDASFSPDGKWHVVCEKFNVVLKPVAGDEPAQILTTDGTKASFYSPPIRWSPNSQFFTTDKTVPGQHREIPIISSSPKDQTQPKIRQIRYDKPGDRLDISRPALFDAKNKKEISISDRETLLSNPFGSEDPQWAPDSSKFYVSYNQRGHQLYQILEVTNSGSSRVLLEEKSATFIDWTNKIFFQRLDKTGEALWMSERDGWNHLYLFDLKTGKLKKQLTKGNWVVRGVERVDEERREVILRVGGVYPEQDPYFVHYAKLSLDTGKLTLLTDGDGTHSAKFSPDGATFVDTYSRVDQPPVHELRSVLTGKKRSALESADVSELLKLGWKVPERFVAKGRDSKTNIYGLIFRPLNFDPTKKYPVIENIYAGPHGQHVPKLFSEVYGSQELAELGFIVVQIDGMGTNWRSKAFHDVCWKNIADGGFPDRIAWMRAAAEKYPELDLSRVGIFGTSAGGQNALHALLLHGDFYKVGVADCGCYDNRMDKVWWNEQWMGWPIGPHYAEQSCVTLAPNLTGKLFLLVGEEDTNVDPSSTMQVVDALIRADKNFDLLVAPGVGHGVLGTPHARRRMWDFFVKNLQK